MGWQSFDKGVEFWVPFFVENGRPTIYQEPIMDHFTFDDWFFFMA